ncbi:MAG: NAD-dependent epimerase/dehydratase family protein [Candidatus Electrothrix scaldis]|nr:MAG: NAD-dependent epimerase/dehydratase family protein [Candidatus Electrothrix sp. GW3-3]
MIIGNGLVASALKKYCDRHDVVIFASGVSNSLEQDSDSFLREERLLRESLGKYRKQTFVYFSTVSVYDMSAKFSAYVQHKLEMEKIVSDAATAYLIFRLPQVVGQSDNGSTLTNFLYAHIKNGLSFDIWGGAVRYLVDIDDVAKFVSFVIDDAQRSNIVVNMSTVACKVLDIVTCLEKITGKKAVFKIINRGSEYSPPPMDPLLTASSAGITIDESYTERVLLKYYKT